MTSQSAIWLRLRRAALSLLLMAAPACASVPPRIVASANGMYGTLWTAEYSSDGLTLNWAKEDFGGFTESRKAPLPPGWWLEVEQLESETRFADLPAKIQQKPAPDGTIQIITEDTNLCIETGGPVHHQVCGTTLDIKLTDDGRRFARLWNHLVADIPELSQSESIQFR